MDATAIGIGVLVAVLALIALGVLFTVSRLLPQGRAGPGADHLPHPAGGRHLHRGRRPAGAAQRRADGHLGEDHRDPADRPRGPDLPGQHPRGHPPHLLRPGQQDQGGRGEGRAGDRHRAGQPPGDAAGAVQREVLRGAQDRGQAAGLRRPLHPPRALPRPDHPGHRHRPQRLPPGGLCDRLPGADPAHAAGPGQHPRRAGHQEDHRADRDRARPHQRVPAHRAEGDHPAERRRPGDHPRTRTAGRPRPRSSSAARSRRCGPRRRRSPPGSRRRNASAPRARSCAPRSNSACSARTRPGRSRSRRRTASGSSRSRTSASRRTGCSKSSRGSGRRSWPGSPRRRRSRASAGRSPTSSASASRWTARSPSRRSRSRRCGWCRRPSGSGRRWSSPRRRRRRSSWSRTSRRPRPRSRPRSTGRARR